MAPGEETDSEELASEEPGSEDAGGKESGSSREGPSGTRESRLPLVSPEDQSATFVELFFDLVFVFSVTQIVALVGHDLSWLTVGQGFLVFWLVWWAWTQFTWALNAANTEHPLVELVALTGTGIAFLMAVTVPDAFAGRALWFAVPYVVVRGLALGLYLQVARINHPSHFAAVRTFALVSVGGLTAALVGGFAGGEAQYWLWGLTIFLDIIAAGVGGQAERWDLHPEHFGERHGLFVIIALGETLIVAASGLTGADWTLDLSAVAVLAVATSCSLWWSYFPGPMPALERGLCQAPAARQGATARDTFSLFHFPMICGVIAFAVALEEAVLHPGEPLATGGRLALAAGMGLFLGGTAASVYRAIGRLLVWRLAVTGLLVVALIALAGVSPATSLGMAFAGVLAVVLVERWPD